MSLRRSLSLRVNKLLRRPSSTSSDFENDFYCPEHRRYSNSRRSFSAVRKNTSNLSDLREEDEFGRRDGSPYATKPGQRWKRSRSEDPTHNRRLRRQDADNRRRQPSSNDHSIDSPQMITKQDSFCQTTPRIDPTKQGFAKSALNLRGSYIDWMEQQLANGDFIANGELRRSSELDHESDRASEMTNDGNSTVSSAVSSRKVSGRTQPRTSDGSTTTLPSKNDDDLEPPRAGTTKGPKKSNKTRHYSIQQKSDYVTRKHQHKLERNQRSVSLSSDEEKSSSSGSTEKDGETTPIENDRKRSGNTESSSSSSSLSSRKSSPDLEINSRPYSDPESVRDEPPKHYRDNLRHRKSEPQNWKNKTHGRPIPVSDIVDKRNTKRYERFEGDRESSPESEDNANSVIASLSQEVAKRVPGKEISRRESERMLMANPDFPCEDSSSSSSSEMSCRSCSPSPRRERIHYYKSYSVPEGSSYSSGRGTYRREKSSGYEREKITDNSYKKDKPKKVLRKLFSR